MIFKKLAISILNTFKTSFSVKSVILTCAGRQKLRICKIKFPRFLSEIQHIFYRNEIDRPFLYFHAGAERLYSDFKD